MTFVYHAGGDRCRVAAFGRDTPARGCGRASLAVVRWLFFLCGLLVWLSASRSRDESRDESPFFSPTPTTEKKKSATPDAPRLLGHCARSVPLFVPSRSLPQKARRVGVLGSRSRFKTPLKFHFPRPRASAMLVPTWGLNCRCSWARRRRGVEVRGASSQRWLCRVPFGGVGVVPCSFQRRLRGLPTPAPDLLVPCSSLKLPLLVPSGAGRGLWWLLVRVPLLRALCGQLREVGGGAVGEAAQNRARRFSFKRAWRKNCRARFTAFGGRRPRSNEAGTIPRTANRVSGVVCASRGLRLSASAILA